MAILNEAQNGDPKKLLDQIRKGSSAVEKAADAVLAAADELDGIMATATVIGGTIGNVLPSHVKKQIAALTDLADQLTNISKSDSDQSALNKLEELVKNTPLGDYLPPSPAENRANISRQPNLAAGPQSQIAAKESFEEFYQNYLREAEVEDVGDNLSFKQLAESSIFGQKYEEDMMDAVNMKLAKPLAAKKVTERLRAAADDEMFEDIEQLQEGELDFTKIKAFGGNDGIPLSSFSTIREGINMVDNT